MHGHAPQDFFYWMRGHLTDIHGPGEDQQENKQLQDQTMCGQICGSICLMHQNAKRRKSGQSRKPRLDNARRLRGYFLYRRWPRRKLETLMPAAMPCRLQLNKHRETCGKVGQHTQDEICMYCWGRRIHEDTHGRVKARTKPTTSQEEAWIHWVTTISYTNLFLCLKPREYLMRRHQWIKNGENWRTYWHGSWRESKTEVRWSLKHGTRAILFILRR